MSIIRPYIAEEEVAWRGGFEFEKLKSKRFILLFENVELLFDIIMNSKIR